MTQPIRINHADPGVILVDGLSAGELRPGVGLTDVEIALIRMLQSDGRASAADIARTLGVPAKTVRRKIQELRTAGIIHIAGVTDPQVLGYGALALLGLKIDPKLPLREVVAKLLEVPNVDYLLVVTGRYDIALELACVDATELGSMIEEDIRVVGGVLDVETFPYLCVHYQRFGFGGTDAASDGVRSQTGLLTDVDQRILRELTLDGRMPFRRIATKLGLPETQIRRRVDRMMTSGAVRVLAITSPISLGFRTMAWVAISVEPGVRVQTVAEGLAQLRSAVYVVICTGRFDLFVDIVATDHEGLLNCLDEEIRAVPGVARAEAWLHLESHWRPHGLTSNAS